MRAKARKSLASAVIGNSRLNLSRRRSLGMWSDFRPLVTKFKSESGIPHPIESQGCSMKTQIPLVFFAACIAALAPIGMPTVQAKAQIKECSVKPASNARGHWSWRLIDGRKCWYAGKAVIPKSSLRWAAVAPAQAKVDVMPVVVATTPVVVAAEKRSDPMDAQARMVDADNTFEARWRARVSSE
jgi:hypothetical protein